MTERALTSSMAAIDAAIETVELGAPEALALSAGARALLELVEVRGVKLREEVDRVALVFEVSGSLSSDAVAAVARRLPPLSGTSRDRDGVFDVTLEVARASGPRAKAPTWERVAQILEERHAREGELERMRDELDETNRGVVALYAELDNHSRELELADRRKNEFLAMLAHELRNPLAALHLAAEDLTNEVAGERGEPAAVMHRQLVHLSRMVDDLLDVSRITRGKVEVSAARMDVVAAVRDAVAPRAPIAADAGLSLELDLPDASLWVDGDPTRVEQVVVNLVDNAIKYSDGEGRVTVSVDADGSEVEITVTDTGRGMTEAELRDAFELFVQHGENQLDRARGGLGIGLTLVREIVAMHGGRVTATSAGLGHGTTVRVRLPRAPGPPKAMSRDAAEERPEPSIHVLLVEDNRDFRELLAARLRRRGCVVEEAEDGVEALDRLRRDPLPQLVLTDVGLPAMDGYALVQAIREDARLAPLRVVALTGYGGKAATERTREAGFDRHLVKPVPMDELMRVIHEH